MTAAHFDAHLGPGPDIPDGPPDHFLVPGLNKVTHDLLELTQVVGLDQLKYSSLIASETGREYRRSKMPPEI